MKTYRGFLFSKLGAMCSKGEVNIYYLQEMDDKEYLLRTENSPPWGENRILEPFVNNKVKIEGEIDETIGGILVKKITNWDCLHHD